MSFLQEASTNQTLWSEEYDGQLDDVFEVQSDIATKISTQLQANLSPSEKNELESIPTKNIKAYDDYLLAKYIVNQPNASYDDFQRGISLLDRAVEADSKFIKA